MSKSPRRSYGLIAEFASHGELLAAINRTRKEGYSRLEAFAPFPVEGLAEAMGCKPSRIPLIVLLGGIGGAASGYMLQFIGMAAHYPLNVGGRPLNSWPLFIPITFELAILSAALCGIAGMLVLNGLPCLYHPVFGVPGFERATSDCFFLCIEATDPIFDSSRISSLFKELKARQISEVMP
jgi:Protein of unknown function (DUF3341)